MYIKARVFPGMKKERVTKTGDHAYELIVREPATRNLANQRVRELIAREYDVEIGKVRIITGHHSPGKVLELTD